MKTAFLGKLIILTFSSQAPDNLCKMRWFPGERRNAHSGILEKDPLRFLPDSHQCYSVCRLFSYVVYRGCLHYLLLGTLLFAAIELSHTGSVFVALFCLTHKSLAWLGCNIFASTMRQRLFELLGCAKTIITLAKRPPFWD